MSSNETHLSNVAQAHVVEPPAGVPAPDFTKYVETRRSRVPVVLALISLLALVGGWLLST